MTYFYSAANNSFYDGDIKEVYEKSNTWPDDARQVKDDVFTEFVNTPPDGKVRGSKSGLPVWVDKPEPTDEEKSAVNKSLISILYMRASDKVSLLTDATDPDVMGDDIDEKDVEKLNLWKKYRVQLSRITNFVDPVIPDTPEE